MRRLWSWVVGMGLIAAAPSAGAADNGRIAAGCLNMVGWINPDGTDNQTFSQRGGHTFGWSPDGSRMAYVEHFGYGKIMVRDAWTIHYVDGVEIGDGTNVFDPLAWSPDDRLAVVVHPSDSRQRPGYADFPNSIDVMNADGSDRHTLVPATHYTWSRPAWSPDGRWLAVGGTDQNDLSLGARIFLFPVANGTVTGPPTVLTQGAFDDAPAWSPTSDSIVFLRGGLGLWQAVVVRVDFTVSNGVVTVTAERVLQPDALPTAGLAWSPDGTTVAMDSEGIDLFDAADGSSFRRIIDADCSGVLGWQPANTPIGSPAVVPVDRTTGTTPVTVTFEQVSAAGATVLVTGPQGPPAPPDFSVAGVYYDIRTTATYSGAIEVCIDTTGLGLPASPPPALMHYELGVGWEQITTSYVGNQLCGTAHSLSPFAVMLPASAAPPVITTPSQVNAEATGPAGAAVTYTVTVSDPSDPSPTLTCAPASGAVFPLGATTVGCTATNASGAQAAASFPVIVADTTPPSLTVPADITVTATSAGGAVVTFTASATDLVGGSLPPACVPASGSLFPVGTTAVQCTAADPAGNSASAAFSVRVDPVAQDPLASLVALVQQLATGSARQQLLAILDGVRHDLAAGRLQDACRGLLRFVTRVVWLRIHHQLPPSSAVQLVIAARQAAHAIHCGCF